MNEKLTNLLLTIIRLLISAFTRCDSLEAKYLKMRDAERREIKENNYRTFTKDTRVTFKMFFLYTIYINI